MNQELRVLAVGAAGPTAGLVVPELLKRQVSVRGFVHKEEDVATVQKLGLQDIVVGDMTDTAAVTKALSGMDALFYIPPAALDDEAAGRQTVCLSRKTGRSATRCVFVGQSPCVKCAGEPCCKSTC